jgi:hypothetical protein
VIMMMMMMMMMTVTEWEGDIANLKMPVTTPQSFTFYSTVWRIFMWWQRPSY